MKNKSNQKQASKFILFDAKGKILGRLATEIAKVLSGKNEVNYEPRLGGKDWVIVLNSDKVRLSGDKENKKVYWRYSGYPGGIYKATFKEMQKKDSTRIIEKAVKGMMPKNKLSVEALKRLRIFKNEEHPYQNQIER
ncbi:MAG: 50S ribosomal protein L13 [Candidatus Moranbacteria bacterium]|nr:50S ribosomal protein L13 [Candidatus Moranbacteria bacterium]